LSISPTIGFDTYLKLFGGNISFVWEQFRDQFYSGHDMKKKLTLTFIITANDILRARNGLLSLNGPGWKPFHFIFYDIHIHRLLFNFFMSYCSSFWCLLDVLFHLIRLLSPFGTVFMASHHFFSYYILLGSSVECVVLYCESAFF